MVCQFSWCPLSQDLDEMCVYIGGVVEVLMQFQVTEIEFDFTDSQGTISEDEQKKIVDDHIGMIVEADDEDDMIEEITATTGWCIKSIDYRFILSFQDLK